MNLTAEESLILQLTEYFGRLTSTMIHPDRLLKPSEESAKRVLSEFGYQWVSSLELGRGGYVNRRGPARRAYDLITDEDQRSLSLPSFEDLMSLAVGGRLSHFNVISVEELTHREVLGRTYALIDSATIATPTNDLHFQFPVKLEQRGWKVAFLRGLETAR